MKKRLTFLTAGIESLFSISITLGVLLLPATLIWLFENDPSISWFVAYRASADFWLAAQGTDIIVAKSRILGVAVDQFALTLIPLGFSAFIAFLAYRVGRKYAIAPQLWPAWTGAILAYGAAAVFISTTAYDKAVYPINWQGTFLPTIFFGFWMILGSLIGKPEQLQLMDLPVAEERERFNLWLRDRWNRTGWVIRVVGGPALRAGTGIVVTMLGFSAALLALMLAFNWIEIINFYESLQVTVLGGIALTVAQLFLLPNAIIFGAIWLTGAGFAIGAGSSFSPLGSAAGPLPNIPLLAALPVGQISFGLLFVLVPLLSAAWATFALKRHAEEIRFEFANPLWAALALGSAIGLVAAVQMGVLTALASGAAGPGRLQTVGASPFVVAVVLFLEVTVVATAAAFYVARPDKPDHPLLSSAQR